MAHNSFGNLYFKQKNLGEAEEEYSVFMNIKMESPKVLPRNMIVYYESLDMPSAIDREKQIKGGSRKKKLALVKRMNPQWNDLYDEIE